VFDDRSLLDQAMTHRSWSHENPTAPALGYERLEFLGDAILGLFVADRLFRDDPSASEGDLTKRMQGIVSMPTLAAAARSLGLGEDVRLGRGEESTGGRGKESILADVFEAVLGAIYLDGGIRPARAFVRRHLAPCPPSAIPDRDAKTELQERLQGRLRLTPGYRIVATSGPAHEREFEVEVVAGDRVLATGRGRSRKGAEQDAARSAIRALDREGTR